VGLGGFRSFRPFQRTKNSASSGAKRHIADRVEPSPAEDSVKLSRKRPQSSKSCERRLSGGTDEILRVRFVDSFFDKVMVMVDDDNLRANRLAHCKRWSRNFLQLPISPEIVTEGKNLRNRKGPDLWQ
jgi:glycyl-tRNA synthetase beta subunit